jgi:cell division protein FtsQ
MATRMSGKKLGTRKSKVMKNRQRRIAGRGAFVLVWLRRFGLALAVVTGVIWAGAWLWLSGSIHKAGHWASEKVLMASAGAGFATQNIYIEGRVYADAEVIKSLIDLQSGDPLFGADVGDIQDKISQMAWVEQARVERRLPDTLYIELKERMPIALYKDEASNESGDRRVVLDQYGKAITDYKLSRFKDLVIVSGDGASEAAPAFIELLHAEGGIASLVLYANRVSNRRWDVKFKSGVVVKLPEDDVGFALKRLVQAQRDDKILERGLQSIDLRDSERMILQAKPGSVQNYKANFSSLKTAL